MKPQVCFVNSENPPISIKHIAWMVQEDPLDSDNFLLIEIVQEEYPHPDAPEHARIFLRNEHVCKLVKKTDRKASSLFLLMAAENNCREIFGESPYLKGTLEGR